MPRSATIVFKCGSSETPIGVSAAEVPIHSLHYAIVLSGAAACPIMPQPLSWGWWTIILFGVFTIGYFGGGTYYNGKYTEAEGLDRIPQWQYWQQRASLPSLACAQLGRGRVAGRLTQSPSFAFCFSRNPHLLPIVSTHGLAVPGLVHDGSVFFFKEARLFSRNGRQYVREWYNGIGSKELREPIAAVPQPVD